MSDRASINGFVTLSSALAVQENHRLAMAATGLGQTCRLGSPAYGLFLVAVLLFGLPAQADELPESGMIGHWTFDPLSGRVRRTSWPDVWLPVRIQCKAGTALHRAWAARPGQNRGPGQLRSLRPRPD